MWVIIAQRACVPRPCLGRVLITLALCVRGLGGGLKRQSVSDLTHATGYLAGGRSSFTLGQAQPTARSSVQPTGPDAMEKPVILEPSQLGRTLSDLTTRRVIVLVLTMLLCVPLFDRTAFVYSTTPQQYSLDVMHSLAVRSAAGAGPTNTTQLFYGSLSHVSEALPGLLHLQLHGDAHVPLALPSDHRFPDIVAHVDDLGEYYRTTELLILESTGCGALAVQSPGM